MLRVWVRVRIRIRYRVRVKIRPQDPAVSLFSLPPPDSKRIPIQGPYFLIPSGSEG